MPGCECCPSRSRETVSPSCKDVKRDAHCKLSDSSVDHDEPETQSCLTTVHPPRRRKLGCQADDFSQPGRRYASPSPVELTPSPPPTGSNPAIEGVLRWQMAAAAAAAAAAPWDAGPTELRRWYAAEVSNLTAECDTLQVCKTERRWRSRCFPLQRACPAPYGQLKQIREVRMGYSMQRSHTTAVCLTCAGMC